MTSYDMVREYNQREKLKEYQLTEQEIELEKQRMLAELGIALYEINRYNPPL